MSVSAHICVRVIVPAAREESLPVLGSPQCVGAEALAFSAAIRAFSNRAHAFMIS